ncbi:MAG: M14 family metallopeptidase, partial [Planctomycetota bacterium]
VKISDNPDIDENEPEAIVDSLTHAREPQGMMCTLYFMEWLLENYTTDKLARFLVEEREMWFVPVHNPDGYVYNQNTNPGGGGLWRKNRRYNSSNNYGVDLNRNWGYKWGYDNTGSSNKSYSETYRGPSAMSEPEVQAMAAFITTRNPVERMSIHTFGKYWLLPWCYDSIVTPEDDLFRALAEEMAPADFTIGTSWQVLYKVNGGSLDWDYGELGIISFSPEIGSSFWPATEKIIPLSEETVPSFQHYFAVAGSYVKLLSHSWSETAGDFNGYINADETISLSVTVGNKGVTSCATPVDLGISCEAPFINILSGTAQLSPLNARSEANTASSPFSIEVLGNAPYGSAFDIVLAIDFDGAVIEETITLRVGTARRMIVDPMESPQAQWELQTHEDTANDGFWEWGEPNGTWNGPDPIQPDEDGTPSGTNCFVTGNAATSDPYDDDIDGGRVRLFTPLFDLSMGEHPRVGFSSWFFKEEGEGLDALITNISNDGGITWTTLVSSDETGMNAWAAHTFDVEKFVTPTDKMQIRWTARDLVNNTLVEAAVDDFWAESFSTHPLLSRFGIMKTNDTCTLGLSWTEAAAYWIYFSPAKSLGVPLQGGTWFLDPPFFILLSTGMIPSERTISLNITLPDMPELIGQPLHFQSFAIAAGDHIPMISNCLSVVVE